jgi:FkbM family methyltransferase
MKLFVCITDDEHGLLAHFLRHYAACGIDRFFIAAPAKLEATLGEHARAYQITHERGLDVVNSVAGGVTAVAQMRQRYQTPDEWVMIVDLDEFVEIDAPLDDIVRDLEAEGATVAQAIMYDRFTRSGELLGFKASDTLSEAFPVKARFNRDVMKGADWKGVFVKGHLKSASAHHTFAGERIFSKVFELAHYRFHGRSLDRLRAAYKHVSDLKIWWADQYSNILRHYDRHGRFAWEEFGGKRDDLLLTDCGLDGGVVHVLHRDNTPDRAVMAQCFSRRDYDMPGCVIDEIAAYHRHITANGNAALVVDAGANIGASALWFSRKWQPCRIVAVEPDRDNFEVLASNLNAEQLDVQFYQAGIDIDNNGAVLIDPGWGEWAYRTIRTGEGRPIRTITLDSILGHNDGYEPFILKIDIEGYEKVLFSANTGAMDVFPVVIIELHDWMLPGQGTSLPFLRWHTAQLREIIFQGDNVFSIDWAKLNEMNNRGAPVCAETS